MTVQFPNFKPFAEFDLFVKSSGNENFDYTFTKFQTAPFTNDYSQDSQKNAKNMELQLLNQELENLNDDNSFDFFARKKFLTEKIKFLSKLNHSNWKQKAPVISTEYKKQNYTQKDIAIMIKVLLAIHKNADFQNFTIIQNHVENCLGKNPNIRILHQFNEIFGTSTLQFLFKSLSYFVNLKKPEYIDIILQIIDIFSNKSHIASGFEIHKEILKNYNMALYKLIYENTNEYEYKNENVEEFGKEGNCDNFYRELKERIDNKINEKDEKKIFKPRAEQGIVDRVIIEAKKYVTSKIKKEPHNFDSDVYIWKYTNINYGVKTTNWYLGTDYPEKAHPRNSEYILIEHFIKYLVDTKDILFERELQAKLANLPSLE